MNLLYPAPLPIHLLLVGGDPANRRACRSALQQSSLSFSIQEAETPGQAVELACFEDFDCVLLDQRRPDFEDLKRLAGILNAEDGSGIPVVMLADSDDPGTALRALELGATDYVAKDAGHGLPWVPAAIFKALREREAHREKRAVRAELETARAKYRGLVEQMPAIVYLASLEQPGKLLYISPRIGDCLGYPVELWRENPEGILAGVHPEDRPGLIEQLSRTYEHHTPLRTEYRMLKRDGRARWMLDEARVVRDETGHALFLQGLLVDITEDKENQRDLEYYRRRLEDLVAQRTLQLEKQSGLLWAANHRMDVELCQRKQAEAALRASEVRFRLLLESVGEGIFGIDAEGRCTFVNRAALSIFGCDEAFEPEGLDLLAALCHCQDDDPPREQCPLLHTLRDGVPTRFTETLLRADGGSFMAELTAYPLRANAGIKGAVVVVRDLGEARSFPPRLAYVSGHARPWPQRLEFEWHSEVAQTGWSAPGGWAKPLPQAASG